MDVVKARQITPHMLLCEDATKRQPIRITPRSQWSLQQSNATQEPTLQALGSQLESVAEQLGLLTAAQVKMEMCLGDALLDIKALPHTLRSGLGSLPPTSTTGCIVKPDVGCRSAGRGPPAPNVMPTSGIGKRSSPIEGAGIHSCQQEMNDSEIMAPMGIAPHPLGDMAPLPSQENSLRQHQSSRHANAAAPQFSTAGGLAMVDSSLSGKGSTVSQPARWASDPGPACSTKGAGVNSVADILRSPTRSQNDPEHQVSPSRFGSPARDPQHVGKIDAVPLPGRNSGSAQFLPEEAHPCRKFVKRLIGHPIFDVSCVVVIFLNTIWMGYQVEWLTNNMAVQAPKDFLNVQVSFTIVFLIELVIRMGGSGVKFFTSRDAGWNIFDLLVTISSVLEMMLLSFSYGSMKNVSFLRVLRILRIVRIVRVVRVFRFFRELRMMVYSILNCMRSLVWAICLLTSINYVAAIFFTQAVSDYRFAGQQDTELASELEQYFAHLYQAMYYLFLSTSGGISWGEIAAPLIELHWSYGIVMCLLISFTMFAVLNIVTAVFVEHGMQTAQMDRDNFLQLLHERDKSAVSVLRRIFKATDVDQSGYIDYEEFIKICEDKAAQASFHQLDLALPEVKTLFFLLDEDKSNSVSVNEFVDGCLRLRGGARNVDMASLMQENKRILKTLTHFTTFVGKHLTRLSDFEDIMLGAKTLQWPPMEEGVGNEHMRQPFRFSQSMVDIGSHHASGDGPAL